ncbi:hypothetical protein D3C87_1962820 [compost metagenome]
MARLSRSEICGLLTDKFMMRTRTLGSDGSRQASAFSMPVESKWSSPTPLLGITLIGNTRTSLPAETWVTMPDTWVPWPLPSTPV